MTRAEKTAIGTRHEGSRFIPLLKDNKVANDACNKDSDTVHRQSRSINRSYPPSNGMVGHAADGDKVTKCGAQKTYHPSLTLPEHYSKTVFPSLQNSRHRTPLAAPVGQSHAASFPTSPTRLLTPPWSRCSSTPALLLIQSRSSRPRPASFRRGLPPSTRLRCLFRRQACRRSLIP